MMQKIFLIFLIFNEVVLAQESTHKKIQEKIPEQVDTGVAGLKLLEIETCNSNIQKTDLDKIVNNKELKVDETGVLIKDSINNQRLILFFSPNTKVCEIISFDIRKTVEDSIPSLSLIKPTNELQTDKHIHLGASRLEVIRKLGKSFVHEKANGREVLTYKFTSEKDSLSYLKRVKQEMYVGRYEFEKGLLVRFKFGFEKPNEVRDSQ